MENKSIQWKKCKVDHSELLQMKKCLLFIFPYLHGILFGKPNLPFD